MRRVLFWVHLSAGCVAGAVILIMSVTGVLLAYERQIVGRADGGYRSAPDSGAQLLPPSMLLSRSATDKNVPTALTLRSDPLVPAEISFGRDRTLFFDRYSGAVVGDGSKRAHEFFRFVTGLHRWLGAANAGRTVTGACNLAFLALILTGPILWLPKQWSWARARQGIWFRGGLEGRARDWNWHNTIGVWSAVPLAIIVFCGAFMSYPWATGLLYRATESKPPTHAVAPPAKPLAVSDAFDKLWLQAEQQVPDWQSITMRAPAVFSIDWGNGGRPDLRAQLTLNSETGDVIRWEPFSSYNTGRRIRTWMRFVHTGEAGGLAGQTVAAIASAGGAFLVWTGISLALRRLFRWRRAARQTKTVEVVTA